MDMKNENESRATETPHSADDAASGCCGGPAATDSNACCALDAEQKAKGHSGCGCGAKAAGPATKGCC